jgi:ABC-type transport system substrate-binding protein
MGPRGVLRDTWLNPGTYVYNKAVYGHLIVADENLNPIPDHPDALATYEYSTDGKTLTFTLRDDAYWHNGDKVTPEDIKWSIEFVSKTPVANAVFVSTFSAIEGSKTNDVFNETFSGIAIDGQKITITFDKIAPDALLTFTQFAPVPKSEFEGIDPLQVQQAPYLPAPHWLRPLHGGRGQHEELHHLAPFDKYYNGVADFKIQMLPSAGDSDPNVVTRAKSGNLDYGYTKMISDVQPWRVPRHHHHPHRRALHPPVLPQQI